MIRVCFLVAALSFLGCSTPPTGNGYRVRTLGVHGDGGEHLQLFGVHFTFRTNQAGTQRKRIDLKVEIDNESERELTLSEDGAELRASAKTWAPIDWMVYRAGRSVGKSAIIKPGERCWLMCSFEVPGKRRERFPRTVTVSIGGVSLDGQSVDVGPIQLYIPG